MIIAFVRLVLRAVWHERSRGLLAAAAMTVGIAGFFAILATYAILQRELNAGYVATNPASAILVTENLDETLVQSIIDRPDVDDAEGRRMLRGRIRRQGGTWQRLTLFVLRDLDHPRMSTVTREQGLQPVQAGDLLIERDAFQVAQARVGDRVDIELQTGHLHTVRVAGGVHDVGQAQARMENSVYAYITPATLPLLGEPMSLNRLYLLASGDRRDATHVQRVAEDVKASLERDGHPVTRVIVPTPGQHPHAVIMGLLLLAMSTLGLLILAISAVIVFTMMLSSVARRRRQIGVMKALGGTRRQIAAIYLGQSAILGLAAIAAGVPVGLAGNRALTDYLARLLNFDITSYAIPAWVYLLAALVGLAAPLLAAAWPVAKGTDVPVREALAPLVSSVRQETVMAGRVRVASLRIASFAPPAIRTGVTLGVRNAFDRPGRAAVSLTTLTMAGASFIAATSGRASMMATIDALFGSGTFGSVDRYALDQHMLMIYAFLLIAAAVLALIGGLAMVTTTSLNVLDRRRELGILRTIGASPATVMGLVVSEAAFIAAASGLLAIVAVWTPAMLLGPLVSLFLSRRGLLIKFSVPGVITWLTIAAAVSLAASIVPAWHAARRSIREEVSYD